MSCVHTAHFVPTPNILCSHFTPWTWTLDFGLVILFVDLTLTMNVYRNGQHYLLENLLLPFNSLTIPFHLI
uniref:Uncharacterized protein n=1 Tax=Solanum lycopersicum TaxID=4081 RepID=A0A3Q7HZ55_SOLLC